MEMIFHEKQEGLLCAQHCLNALLQGPFFTPVDLATLAERLDDEERQRMAESGVDSHEYRTFIQEPSGNMDDTGYFSVQVISSALQVWSLELVPFTSSEPLSKEANLSPESMRAYICNYRDHWFTIRKIGYQWFNLNSLLSRPELISNTYLSIFLAQLQQEGYSIFIVKGNLPDSPADELLRAKPAVQSERPRVKTATAPTAAPLTPKSQQDLDLERAIKLSLGQEEVEEAVEEEEEDADLRRALRLSLAEDASSDPSLQRALNLSLICQGEDSNSRPLPPSTLPSASPSVTKRREKDEEEEGKSSEELRRELEGAIRLSLEGHEPPSTTSGRVRHIPITIEPRAEPPPPVSSVIGQGGVGGGVTTTPQLDLEEVRRRRLAYIGRTMTER